MDQSSHSLLLLQQLNMQREFGFLCDCTVAIGDVYFKAHRAVLAAFSNYFKMIFIHQTSECIKIQPTDIQPDIFSFLLHVMYTGKSPKQSVDQYRLEEGVKFLHANLFTSPASEPTQVLPSDTIQTSNLYGIQISTAQKAPKESLHMRKNQPSATRPIPQGEHPQLQLSLAIGLEGVGSEQQSSHFTSQIGTTVQSIEDIQKSVRSIKQETSESESMSSPNNSLPPSDEVEPNLITSSNRVYSCHYCGEHFESRVTLRDHLHIHVSQSLPFGVPTSILESDDLGEVRPILENIESADTCRLGGYLLNRTEEPLLSANHAEQLQLNQLSFLTKDADPIELNFSFLRKRKFSCTVCGHRFARRSQLLEHVHTHKTKPHKYQRIDNLVEQNLHSYCSNITDISQKEPDLLLDPPEFLEEEEPTDSQENVESVLVE
ncbi:zinc finger and BTB domain-containing protein 25 [Bufo bufo]|uniref:zinc finger and BTB domain-containing protein 25 n=1 Tax=Bufo bufo TaxID=8384 RepID=UPI001ABE261D|nr:zinc finger and BTB domain-containing protein 25 [Bufo bufo]